MPRTDAAMKLLHAAIPIRWAVAGWLALLPSLWLVLREGRTAPPLRGAQQHLWLAGVVFLAWLWTLQVRTADGAAFGLLGSAIFALVSGRAWARLGLLLAIALHAGLADGSWANVGVNGLLLGVGWLLTPAAAAGDPIACALLLACGETLASGMLFSALVIFGPHLVLTYRQDLYLPPRPQL